VEEVAEVAARHHGRKPAARSPVEEVSALKED
jgi:hypothetical protein